MKKLVVLFCIISFFTSCKKDDSSSTPTEPNLIIKLKFDPDQVRLNNIGQPSTVPDSHATQTPKMKKISSNYIEFAHGTFTPLGKGTIIYQGPRTADKAIDFQKAIYKSSDEVFFKIPLKSITPDTYKWARVSLAYQEGDIELLVNGTDITGTLASFVGDNTYITTYNLNGQSLEINGNKKQGFWAFETLGKLFQGQAPAGATTVPNPLFNTSPVPQGSCVVTGVFANSGLTITGNETKDITVVLSFSINESIEWVEVNKDGKYEPGAGERIVDMGLRGLVPIIE